mgnify:CR=1 FL=1
MRTLSEQDIRPLAPNDSAFRNGKKISDSGAFTERVCSKDESYYAGSCKGSGKSLYQVSACFEEGKAPVIRCSCPSRQFPCKHGIALLFEIAAGKDFAETEIPEDIVKKQEKLKKRDEKKSEEKAELAEGKPQAKKKSASGQTAFRKKTEKQLEGLLLLDEALNRRMKLGLLSSLTDTKEEDALLVKRLGDNYLSGPQQLFKRFTFLLNEAGYAREQAKKERLLRGAVRELEKLRTLVRRGSAYLTERLEATEPDANPLYDALGGVRKKEELETLGLKLSETTLLQLAFEVRYDEAKREFLDLGHWISLSDGTLYREMNFRPLSAKNYIAEKDSSDRRLRAEHFPYYPAFPGEAARIRLEDAIAEQPEAADFARIIGFAAPIAQAAKQAAKALQSVLAEDKAPALLQLSEIAVKDEAVYLRDAAGSQLRITDANGSEAALRLLSQFDTGKSAVFGLFFADEVRRELCFLPQSLVTGRGIIRLML